MTASVPRGLSPAPLRWTRWVFVLMCLPLAPAFAAEPPITALVFAPDGRAVVAGSQLGLRIFSWPDLQEVVRNSDGPSMILSLDFLEDRLLVGGGEPSESGYLSMMTIEAGAANRTMQLRRPVAIANGFIDCVYAARWSPDGRQIAAASFDGTAAVFDASDRHRTAQFDGHSGGLTDIAWLSDDRIASSSRDATIRVWDPREGRLIRTLNNHTNQVMGLAVAPAGGSRPVMSSIGDDRSIRFWQPTIGRMMRFARLSDERPICHRWTAGGRSVVVGTTAGRVVEIDAATAQVIGAASASSEWVTALAVAPDGEVLCGTAGGELKVVPLDRLSPGG